MLKILSIIFLAISFTANARQLTMNQKLNDFNELLSRIQTGYGPLEYKKKNFDIDITKLAAEYEKEIRSTKNNSEFYYSIIRFVAEFNDSHFGARIPTDHIAKLGFRTDYIDGKVLIESIDREILSEEDFPFKKGDEIISFNNSPVAKELNSIFPYMGQGRKLTALRKAAMMLTVRPGSTLPVPEGTVKLKVKRGASTFSEDTELKWNHSGTPLDEFISRVKKIPRTIARAEEVDFDQISLPAELYGERSFRCSGTTRIKIPEDATIIMKEPFVAYYHPTEKGPIGYLRIPHYSPKEKDTRINPYRLRFQQYEYAVAELEKNTVGLIIDQDHNCGGSVAYLHRIVSLFAKKPFAPMQFELLASKGSYLDFKRWMDKNFKLTLDYQDRLAVSELIKETWLNEESFLTKKTSISGASTVYPNSIRYTKPIIILIDELSGSGGDGFPAMMQGIGRAKLLGTQTMGAGGHVVSLPPLANSQINVRITKSLFYHPNNVAIENNGASPDIPYSPTREDFVYEYQDYQRFYLKEISKIIK